MTPGERTPRGHSWATLLLGARPAGRWAVPGAQGRTHPAHRPLKERQRLRQRYRHALGLRAARAQPRRNAREWRATETVLAPPGDGTTLWPYGPPGRHSCGLPVRCRTVGEHGASWLIRHVLVNRACAPGPHPAMAKNCTRRTKRASRDLHQTGPGSRVGWPVSPPANRSTRPARRSDRQTGGRPRSVGE
jgi:hypothetical protein